MLLRLAFFARMALTAAVPFDRAERLYITGGDRKFSDCNLHGYSLRIYYYRKESMSSRRKVLLKVIILGDSGSVCRISISTFLTIAIIVSSFSS